MNHLLQISESSSGPLLFWLVFGLIIWAILLYFIITSASQSGKIKSLLDAQLELMKEMAIKNGVEEERVKKIVQIGRK